MQGWIKLHRQIREHNLYKQKRRFSQFEAWIDLLLRANHKKTKILMDYQTETVGPGEFITSEVQLGKDWRWDRKTVRKFLAMLEDEKMIVKTGKPKWTHISITNWSSYQSNGQEHGQEKDTVPYQKIIDLYNEICTHLPKVKSITKGRKEKLKTRWEELGSIEEFEKVFTLTSKSPFLNGKNDRGWKANLDWLIVNDTNIAKVLEGRYDKERKDDRPKPW